MRERLYSSYVWSSMLHGSETWPVRKEDEVALQRAEMKMVRSMCIVKVKVKGWERDYCRIRWHNLGTTGCVVMGMSCERKTVIGWRNVWSMKWRAPDQEVDQRGLGERLCKKTVRHVNWTGRMLWIVVDEDANKGWLMITIGVSGWMFLLVLAHLGSPGQRAVKNGYKVVVVVVLVQLPWGDFSTSEILPNVESLSLLVIPVQWDEYRTQHTFLFFTLGEQ